MLSYGTWKRYFDHFDHLSPNADVRIQINYTNMVESKYFLEKLAAVSKSYTRSILILIYHIVSLTELEEYELLQYKNIRRKQMEEDGTSY